MCGTTCREVVINADLKALSVCLTRIVKVAAVNVACAFGSLDEHVANVLVAASHRLPVNCTIVARHVNAVIPCTIGASVCRLAVTGTSRKE